MTLAVEYPFWDEKTPELLMAFGPPIDPAACHAMDVEGWQRVLTESMTQTLDALGAAAVARDASAFTVLGEGRRGVGGVYDAARRVKAWARGKRFEGGHGGSNPTQL